MEGFWFSNRFYRFKMGAKREQFKLILFKRRFSSAYLTVPSIMSEKPMRKFTSEPKFIQERTLLKATPQH